MARRTTRSTGKPGASASGATRSGSKASKAGRARQAKEPVLRSANRATPKPGVGDLLDRIEKLERGNLTLRSKQRDFTRVSQQLEERIGGLEEELRALGERVATASAPAKGTPRRQRRRPASEERDPGDAVPSGVAVQDPEPLSSDDERVRHRLEDLGSE